MSDQPTNHETPASDRAAYEAPRILEDLPLEAFSLSCDKGAPCQDQGGANQS